MFFRLAAALAASLACLVSLAGPASMPARTLEGQPAAHAQFRAPGVPASAKVELPPLAAQKMAPADAYRNGQPLKVGDVRVLDDSVAAGAWLPVSGGFVSRILVTSGEAAGLRVKLAVNNLAPGSEARVQGQDDRIESVSLDHAREGAAFTPWTEGAVQMIEVFSPVRPADDAVSVVSVVHFTDSPLTAKAAGSCTISTMCTTGDTALDAAIAERKKSVAKISFVEGSSAFLCSGTLINSERFPAPFFMTANHCISTASAASTVTAFWFYEETSCGSGVPGPAQQTASGAELVFANYDMDSTLLKLNDTPPVGAVYAPWSSALLQPGASMVSISHPAGDTSRYALGSITTNDAGIDAYPQRFNLAQFSRGIIEGGSSGSGLFTLQGGSLLFRGTLLGTTVGSGGMSCTNTNEQAIYSRFDVFEQQVDQYLRFAAQAPDDAPNRVRDLQNLPFSDPNGVDRPLNERGGSTLAIDNLRIDYPGDVDVFRFRVTATAWVNVWTEGAQDTMGDLLDSSGHIIVANDDWQVGPPYNMGIARHVPPGTYYVQVSHFDKDSTGAYSLRMRADDVDVNYTDLWWNPSENGWGLNVNHQGNTLFGTLYTYDASGRPAWYSMSNGSQQADGSYSGDLVRTTGPAFNASPWDASSVLPAVVGQMTLRFSDLDNGTLTYSVNGAQVTKAITRIRFATPPVCKWSASDRSYATNYQDLWWGGQTESGWGVNVTHQGNVLFATLFTYDASGQPLWLVMSSGTRSNASNGGSASYTGALYRTHGPPFNAVPFTPITAADNTQVGTMTFSFTNGNAGTMTYSVDNVIVTKPIQRLVFGAIKTQCSPGS